MILTTLSSCWGQHHKMTHFIFLVWRRDQEFLLISILWNFVYPRLKALNLIFLFTALLSANKWFFFFFFGGGIFGLFCVPSPPYLNCTSFIILIFIYICIFIYMLTIQVSRSSILTDACMKEECWRLVWWILQHFSIKTLSNKMQTRLFCSITY